MAMPKAPQTPGRAPSWRPLPLRVAPASPLRGLALLLGAVAWFGAVVVGALLAVFCAATVLVIAIMSSVLLGLTVAAVKVKDAMRGSAAPGLIEARRVGGHSWVAYRWDGEL
jgi:hypothetical protein